MTAEEIIAEQLRRIVRLLTIFVTKDMTQREQIVLLASAGFQPKEIAELVGTTPNTVSVTLYALRKGAKRGRPKPSKPSGRPTR